MDVSRDTRHVLHYLPNQGIFYFTTNDNLSLPGMKKIRAEGRTAYAFSSSYPTGAVGVKAFCSLYPKNAADKFAAEEVQKLKASRELVDTKATVERYSDLFTLPPFAHQIDGIERMLQYDRLALLYEQGLGKTYMAIMAIRIRKEQGKPHKAIVVCPKIVLPNWIREIQNTTNLKPIAYIGLSAERKDIRKRIREEDWDIIVTTFDMLNSRAKNSSKIPMTVYNAMWRALSKDSKEKYIGVWQELGIVDAKQTALLLKDNTTAKYHTVLRNIPPHKLPINQLRQEIDDADDLKFLRDLPYSTLIVDEASRVISHTSVRSDSVATMSGKAKKTILMSGTLCVGRPSDMFMPAKILDENILGGNWTRFKYEYCTVSPSNKNIITGFKNLDRMKLRIDPYIHAQTREACLDLPDRVFTRRYYELSEDLIDLYDEIVLKDDITVDDYTIFTPISLVKLSKLMQLFGGFIHYDPDFGKYCANCNNILHCVNEKISYGGKRCIHAGERKTPSGLIPLCTSPKIAMLEEDLSDCGNEKVIIWAWYREDLRQIEELLKRQKIPYITADTKNCDGIFESDAYIRVFLGQTRQGIGITLNSATCTIYYSHGLALEPRLQSMDRNHRIGQKKSVLVKDYVCQGTLEENVLTLLEHKRDVMAFMQTKHPDCLVCERFGDCDSGYMQAGCYLYGERDKAEHKRMLRLSTLRSIDYYKERGVIE